MKKIILFICLTAITITLNSCLKCTYYYAYCENGHPSWKGNEWESCGGDRAESQNDSAWIEARNHDNMVHGGVKTATVQSVRK